jgi:hypothetical protein
MYRPHVAQTRERKTLLRTAVKGHAFKGTYGSVFDELKTDVFRSKLFWHESSNIETSSLHQRSNIGEGW